jgi:phage terminase large subunit GpA-like protein
VTKPLTHQSLHPWRNGFLAGFRPVEPLWMDEWADTHRKLSEKSSPEPGQWRTSRVPFMREIMQALSAQCDVQDVSLMKGTQISGTEVGNNFIGYTIDHDPAPTMAVQPTLDMGKRYSRQRIAPMLNDMPSLAAKIAPDKSRDSGNTMLEKDFVGGYLVITGANSATGLRSMPVRKLFMDETDAYPFDLDGEGDPEQLAIKRTQNFIRRKIFRVSTPTVDGMSRIQRSFGKGDQRYYYVPCPHCGAEQHLKFPQLKWNKSLPREQQPVSVHYECEHCHTPIQEHHKTAMLAAGHWVAHNPTAPKYRRSYHLNSLYSPLGWYSWSSAVQDWLDAQGDIELLKTFTNTVLAECWKESVNDVSAKMLQARAEPYERGIIPRGGLVLVGSVDVQDNRLEASVYAVGRGEEQWFVDYEVFYGDPGIANGEKNSPWDELDDWLLKPWRHISGSTLTVEGYAVDSGGHHTHDVYNYVRTHTRYGAIAVKGSNERNKPIINRPSKVDIDWRGRSYKHGVDLYMVGTDTAKSLIYNRYQREERAGAGTLHFPDWLPFEIFEQLTAEKLVRKYKNGFALYEWAKSSAARNEALDCAVYVQAVIQKIGIQRYSNQRWDTLESALRTTDLFSAVAVAVTPPVRKPPTNNNANNFAKVSATW